MDFKTFNDLMTSSFLAVPLEEMGLIAYES